MKILDSMHRDELLMLIRFKFARHVREDDCLWIIYIHRRQLLRNELLEAFQELGKGDMPREEVDGWINRVRHKMEVLEEYARRWKEAKLKEGSL